MQWPKIECWRKHHQKDIELALTRYENQHWLNSKRWSLAFGGAVTGPTTFYLESIIPPLILNLPSSSNSRCLERPEKGMIMEQRVGHQKFSPNSQHPNKNKNNSKSSLYGCKAIQNSSSSSIWTPSNLKVVIGSVVDRAIEEPASSFL